MSVVESVNASGVFRVGDVLSRTWRLFTGNILFFLAVPFVVQVVTFFVAMASILISVSASWATNAPVVGGLGIFLLIIVVLALNMIGQGVLLLGAFQRLHGLPIRIFEALRRVLARFVPLFGLVVLWTLAIGATAGLLFYILTALAAALGWWFLVLAPLFVIPPIALLVIWAVSLPACVVEGLGPIASMGRSADLSSGYRWKILGIMLLAGVLFLVGYLLQIVLAQLSPTVAGIYGWVLLVAWIAYWNCMTIMVYHDLRVAKEGIDLEQIASIFD